MFGQVRPSTRPACAPGRRQTDTHTRLHRFSLSHSTHVSCSPTVGDSRSWVRQGVTGPLGVTHGRHGDGQVGEGRSHSPGTLANGSRPMRLLGISLTKNSMHFSAATTGFTRDRDHHWRGRGRGHTDPPTTKPEHREVQQPPQDHTAPDWSSRHWPYMPPLVRGQARDRR